MAKELIWNDDYEFAYGRQVDFENRKDFVNEVVRQYEDGPIRVVDVKIQTCFCSDKTLEGERLIPLQHVEFAIENYYVGRIELVEENED